MPRKYISTSDLTPDFIEQLLYKSDHEVQSLIRATSKPVLEQMYKLYAEKLPCRIRDNLLVNGNYLNMDENSRF